MCRGHQCPGLHRIAEQFALPLQVGPRARHLVGQTEAALQIFGGERGLPGLAFDALNPGLGRFCVGEQIACVLRLFLADPFAFDPLRQHAGDQLVSRAGPPDHGLVLQDRRQIGLARFQRRPVAPGFADTFRDAPVEGRLAFRLGLMLLIQTFDGTLPRRVGLVHAGADFRPLLGVARVRRRLLFQGRQPFMRLEHRRLRRLACLARGLGGRLRRRQALLCLSYRDQIAFQGRERPAHGSRARP